MKSKLDYSNRGDGDGHGSIPRSVASEQDKHGKRLKKLESKMFELIMDQTLWSNELELNDGPLFEYKKDPVGLTDIPTHLCVGTEEVEQAIAAKESGEPKPCQIPSEEPPTVATKRIVVDNNGGGGMARLFLFCDDPKERDLRLGGLHFPFAAVHATPSKGKLVVAIDYGRRRPTTSSSSSVQGKEIMDAYIDEYHFCPNHEVYVHTLFEQEAARNGGGSDEGEL